MKKEFFNTRIILIGALSLLLSGLLMDKIGIEWFLPAENYAEEAKLNMLFFVILFAFFFYLFHYLAKKIFKKL